MFMKEMTKEFWDDFEWAESHHTELAKKYPDLWVAVVDKKVVAYGNNLSEVKKEALKKTWKTEIAVFFVDTGEHIYGAN